MRTFDNKGVYESPFKYDRDFKVRVRCDGLDLPEYCGNWNEAGHIIPYPETLQTYIFPLIKSAGLGEDGLQFEREYIVSSKRHGLLYRGVSNLLRALGDMPSRSWSGNGLSFGAHYRIKDAKDYEIFHAKMLYDDGPYGEIEFEVEYYDSIALKYRYGWRCWDDEKFVYDLDYAAMDATTDIFGVLENAKTRYRPSSVFFDIDSYMQIPRFMRPRGSFQIPLFPGSNGLASRKVRHVLNKMNWLCAEYEYNKYKKIKPDKTR
ncbi:MAG: hypothetical protein IKM94_04695 [Alphaproteobacteria bacterium]|nr:hypothetical protein [Alphaproteobacteria bacterium]